MCEDFRSTATYGPVSEDPTIAAALMTEISTRQRPGSDAAAQRRNDVCCSSPAVTMSMRSVSLALSSVARLTVVHRDPAVTADAGVSVATSVGATSGPTNAKTNTE